MRKKLPVGLSDFKEVIDNQYYYIDKTLLIKEMIDSGSKVILIPRPRRFGKTLNLSMLRYFFEKTGSAVDNLFDNLAIDQAGSEYRNHQHAYPVIYLTLKDVKERDWESAYYLLEKTIAEEYKRHDYLLTSDALDDFDKKIFTEVMTLEAGMVFYKEALKDLSRYLERHHQRKVIILIDEYDAPIQAGFVNGYYDDVVDFIRSFFSGGLKDNPALEKGLLTGILRVAKESIFSGLNNLSVYSLLNEKFSQHFGLLPDEVRTILTDYGLEDTLAEVTDWYDGYCFGGEAVYNPWSIVQYIENGGVARPYWINTSSNDLIQRLVTESGSSFKQDLEVLMADGAVKHSVYEDITFHEVKSNHDLWSFLLFSGYLTAESQEMENGRLVCSLRIPNFEVKYFYEETIRQWFHHALYDDKLKLMLQSLTTGQVDIFEEIFQEYVMSSLSLFDVGGEDPEKVYHAFVLGMLIYLSQEYELKSNRESGYGRYDIMLIPQVKNRPGIVMEFKKVKKGETLEEAAEKALTQIAEKRYRQELLDRGVEVILEIGLAFQGKQVCVHYR